MFRSDRSGQTAVEYLMVFGIALLLSAPFIIKAQTSIIELRSGSNAVKMHNSLNSMESAVKTVNAAGSPAKRTFSVEIPDNIDSSAVNEHSIVYNLSTPNGLTQLSRTFKANLTGSVPSRSGRHRVSVRAKPKEVELSVVS